MEIDKSGLDLLNTPILNKGTAFTEEERKIFGLEGLLPPHVSTLEEQIERSYHSFNSKKTALEKYDTLISLLSRNECLFYQFALRYPKEILPIIYTPTVGDAALQYSRIYFQHRGLYLSYLLEDRLEAIFEAYPQDDIAVIVVTDGERILGLGDLGIGGTVIPVGKLCLYTLFGGIHPSRTLPIMLDVGTNNKTLLADNLYLGCQCERISGKEYDRFIEKFIAAVKKRYPKALLQWEDFGRHNARRLLSHYREKILSFNDDIQGTAAVVLGGLLSAVKTLNQSLSQQKIVIVGGGSAGTGIADMIVQEIMAEGLSYEQACRCIFMIDLDGLLHFASSQVSDAQKPYVQPRETFQDWKGDLDKIQLMDVIVNAHPTILIGVCAQGGVFTKEVIEQMCTYVDRPIIFPLSNPTSRAECTAQEAIEWSRGKVLIGTGSPFDPVVYEDKTYEIAQCNNVYIFPGVGLGAVAVKAKVITDAMFLAAARTLAAHSPALKDPGASLFPSVENIRKVSHLIAIAVAKQACADGVSAITESEIEGAIEANIWEPSYAIYTKSSK